MLDKQKISLVIDTDIGTDCDDAFALAYAMLAMKAGELQIKSITTTQENNQIRAKIARKLERIIGVDIPIFSGAAASEYGYEKNGQKRKSYCGFEHLALTSEELAEPLKEYPLVKYNEADTLVGIGPLTNIANGLSDNTNLRDIKKVYLMGLNENSHNFKLDLESSKKVLSHNWKKYLITSEISKQVALSREDIAGLRGTKLGDFLADSAIRWLDFSGKKESKMYDVLAVSSAMNEGYVAFLGNYKSAVSDYVNPMLKQKILETIKYAS